MSGHATPPCVLVVDDSATYRHAIADELAEDGYRVLTATSGEEALDVLAADTVDAVCLDMVMAGIDGMETCRRLRTEPRWRALPVVMLTSREGMEPMVEALQAGADDFVEKSNDMAVLKARLRAQLRRRHVEEENARMRDELAEARRATDRARADRERAELRANLLADLEAKNAELERARDTAEEAVRLRDEFLVIASHELRTPLTSLQLQIEAAIRLMRNGDAGTLGPRLREKLEFANRQTERFAALIYNLLDVSTIGAGRLVIRREPLDLAELANAVVQRFRADAERANTVIEVGGAEHVAGRWDRARVEQIIGNLVSNAIKYGGGGGVGVRVEGDGESARIDVRDRGIGIAETETERIFGCFERGVSWRNYGGLGLGLYITRKLVEAHGGRVRCESRVGEGSRFVVELPLDGDDSRGVEDAGASSATRA